MWDDEPNIKSLQKYHLSLLKTKEGESVLRPHYVSTFKNEIMEGTLHATSNIPSQLTLSQLLSPPIPNLILENAKTPSGIISEEGQMTKILKRTAEIPSYQHFGAIYCGLESQQSSPNLLKDIEYKLVLEQRITNNNLIKHYYPNFVLSDSENKTLLNDISIGRYDLAINTFDADIYDAVYVALLSEHQKQFH